MKTTRYFENIVRPKRPYLKDEWLIEAWKNPIHKQKQPNGRVRHYVYIAEAGKYLRVVFEGDIVHNAFLDRRFTLEKH